MLDETVQEGVDPEISGCVTPCHKTKYRVTSENYPITEEGGQSQMELYFKKHEDVSRKLLFLYYSYTNLY